MRQRDRRSFCYLQAKRAIKQGTASKHNIKEWTGGLGSSKTGDHSATAVPTLPPPGKSKKERISISLPNHNIVPQSPSQPSPSRVNALPSTEYKSPPNPSPRRNSQLAHAWKKCTAHRLPAESDGDGDGDVKPSIPPPPRKSFAS